MKKENFDKINGICKKIEGINEIMHAVEKDKYGSCCFALEVMGLPKSDMLYFPADMESDILDLCKKYKEMYEQQLEEL